MAAKTSKMQVKFAQTHSENEKKLYQLFLKKSFLVRHPPEKPFKLASGLESYRYFDCKMVTHDPEGVNLIAGIILDRISHYPRVDAVGGLETGAIPIAVAVAQLSYLRGNAIPAFFVRQNQKKHGTEKWVEGNLQDGANVVIVDDVTTKGGSVGKAVQEVEKLGCTVLEIITLVDREEGASDRFKKYRFTPIFRMSEFPVSE